MSGRPLSGVARDDPAGPGEMSALGGAPRESPRSVTDPPRSARSYALPHLTGRAWDGAEMVTICAADGSAAMGIH